MARIEIIKEFPGSPEVGSQMPLDILVEKYYASPKYKEFYKIIIEVEDYIVFLKSFDDCKEGDVVRIDKVVEENKSSTRYPGIWLSYLRPTRVTGGFKIKTTSNGYTYGKDFRLATEKEITSISMFPIGNYENGEGEIFKGDTAFGILKHNLGRLGEISVMEVKQGVLYFKTREEAEEYYILNKPCLTLKNVLEAAEFPLFDFEGKIRTIVKNTMKYD